MELGTFVRRRSKGQLMTIILLALFVLMLAELVAFVLINVSSNNIVQSLAVSSGSNNYANLLKLSANNFAKDSLTKAIATLTNYEYNSGLRKLNLITNTSLYLSDLVINGNLPNDTSGYPQGAMGNLTLLQYNKSIANLISFAGQVITANETIPNVFQTDPYHISVSYTERIALNVSGNNYKYNIPVNVTLPLNNSPDLFYAQQGIIRTIKFANLTNITSVVGGTGVSAISGNTIGYSYGTVLSLISGQSSGAACASVPTLLRSAPFSTNIIIVTFNAMGLDTGGCENNYAGLITYNAPATLPTVPYLRYSDSSGILKKLPSGTRVLINGPSFDVIDMENLRLAAANNNYFASPFAPSYLDRGQGNLRKQSQNGIFSLSTYNAQSLGFPGQSGNKASLSATTLLKPINAITVSAWVYSRNGYTSTANAIVGTGGGSLSGGYCGYLLQEGSFIVCNTGTNSASPSLAIGTNSWHMLTGVYNSTLQKVYFYVDANLIGTAAGPLQMTYATPPSVTIGEVPGGGAPFNGLIANVQIYNNSLPGQQISTLYTEGIQGLPISDNALVGWWPLGINAQDASGYNNNGVITNAKFMLLPNYTRDAIFNVPVPTPLSPIPGLLCYNSVDCGANTNPQVYIGYMPLESQSGYLQVGEFNAIAISQGMNSNIKSKNAVGLSSNSFSMSVWFDPRIQCSVYNVGNGNEVPVSQNAIGGLVATSIELDCSHSSNKWRFDLLNTVGAQYTVFGNSLAPNNWNLATLTYDDPSKTMALYINGSLQGTNVIAGATGSKQFFYIGEGDNFFPGNIANVQLYNGSLTASQVTSLYLAGISSLPVISTNLIGWWPLNGDVRDYASGNNGIATNVVYPYFTGNYNVAGVATGTVAANEWQALGLANT